MAGSRPGNVIAGTWASMLNHGRDGYKKQADGILKAHKNMR
jgi:glutamate/tyrosine decarboxylase-like PLP-dependent enzyme